MTRIYHRNLCLYQLAYGKIGFIIYIFSYLKKIFNYSLHSMLSYIRFRSTASWLDNRVLYKVSPPPPDVSSPQLAPFVVITMLLPVVSVLYHIASCDCSVTPNLCFLMPSPFSPSPSTSLPSGYSLYLRVCFCFVCAFMLFLRFHIKVKSYGLYFIYLIVTVSKNLSITLNEDLLRAPYTSPHA